MLSRIRDRLNQFPRLTYVQNPTPLSALPRLTAKLAGPTLWIKRDDGLGPGLGGNKGRKLEFLMADVLQKKKKKVIAYGGLQSNHVQMTAAACARLGLACHLFFFEKRPSPLQGNLFLDALLGAKLHFIPFGGGGEASMTLAQANRLVKMLSTIMVGPGAYFIPNGGHSIIGCLGYVAAALEIQAQLIALNLPLDQVTVITAVGSGGTLAGLMAGFQLIQSPVTVLGLDIGKLWRAFPATIAHMAEALCAVLGETHSFRPAAAPLIAETYAGPGYSIFTPETAMALHLMAQYEGIVLDPVYTGKAFAGLLDLINKGKFSRREHVVFLHTGGMPGLWAYNEELAGTAMRL